MKKNKILCCLSSLTIWLFMSFPLFAKDSSDSTSPSYPEQLKPRLETIGSALKEIDFVLTHLDKNIVLFQVIPLSEAHTSFDDVSDYATTAITESLNFNFVNFRHILSESSEFYSNHAFAQLQKFLTRSDVLNKTKQRHIVNSAVLMAPAVVTQAEIEKLPHPNIPNMLRDIYTWHIEIPLFIQAYANEQLLHTLMKNFKVKVVRSSVEYSVEQMLIDNIIIEDYNPGV